MLGKLLKYDFKILFKTTAPTFAAALLIGFLTRILNLLADWNNLFSIPAALMSIFFTLAVIFLPMLTFVFTIMKFYQNLVKDEGYLIHTLPVSKHKLVLSKTISSFIVLGISLIVSIIVVLIGIFDVGIFDNIFIFLRELWEMIPHSVIFITIITVIIGVITQQLMFYAAIALGQTRNNHKVGYSIAFGIGLYYLNQMLGLILLIPMAFNDKFASYYKMDIPPVEFLNVILLISGLISLVCGIVYYIITVKVFEKKLNLE